MKDTVTLHIIVKFNVIKSNAVNFIKKKIKRSKGIKNNPPPPPPKKKKKNQQAV